MPNFGKVHCFRKFSINSLKLKEVLLLGIGANGITTVHDPKGEQKGLKSVIAFNFFVRQPRPKWSFSIRLIEAASLQPTNRYRHNNPVG